MLKDEISKSLDEIGFLSMRLENMISDLAMIACKAGAPHNVHWIMAEHDKIARMVRRLNQVAAGV